MEALALENNLIKQRTPKYNILLRDDKNYPYLQLTTSEAFPRVLVARRVEKDGDFYAGPVPAGQAGAADDGAVAPAVRHPVVQRGDHRQPGAAVPRVRHQAVHRAVRGGDLHARSSTASRWPTRGCCSRGGTTSSIETLRDRMADAAGGERFEEAAQLRDAHADGADAARPAAEGGDRAARRSRRLRPEGRAERRRHPGLRDARRPRGRARRAGDRAGRRGAAATPTCCRRRCSSSTSCACRRRRSTCRSRSRTPRPIEAWLSARAGRRVQILGAAARRQARARGAGDAQRGAVVPHAVQRDHRRALRRARDAARRARPAVDSAPHRVLRHLDHPGQRDGGVDGRLRRRADEEERVPEVPDSGVGGHRL